MNFFQRTLSLDAIRSLMQSFFLKVFLIPAIDRITLWSASQVENSLLPTDGCLTKRISTYAFQFFQLCTVLPIALGSSMTQMAIHWISGPSQNDPPLIAFAKHPIWQKDPVGKTPVEIGFATADFQENGPDRHPNTNWGHFYQIHHPTMDHDKEVPDLWNHPARIIDRLKELGCKKFRFSVSRDQLEPLCDGKFDPQAVEHYRKLCRMLKEAGVEPMVTLHHFSDPIRFDWQNEHHIEGFVRYAAIISNILYEEGVRKIITINEPTVVAFQGWVMGEFPPHKTLDVQSAAKVLENMVHAHTQAYKAIKERHPDLQIGITHDPIRFRHFHKMHPIWTPQEKLICRYLTRITHESFFECLKTGKFSLKMPLLANHAFTLDEKPPLDFIGLQYYCDPLLKLSLSGGASVTREPNEKISSYQYRMYPQGLASALHEMSELNIPIELTEIGIDTGVNVTEDDQERIRYFERILQVVQKALFYNVPIQSLYFWTLIDNLEWYKGWDVRFGFYHFDPKTETITPRAVAGWLKKVINKK